MSGSRRRLILFARFPEPGRVKTRLIPLLGAEGAAALHRRLVLRTLRTALAAKELGIEVLSVYSFSTENWKRPEDQVQMLMQLFDVHLTGRMP